MQKNIHPLKNAFSIKTKGKTKNYPNSNDLVGFENNDLQKYCRPQTHCEVIKCTSSKEQYKLR